MEQDVRLLALRVAVFSLDVGLAHLRQAAAIAADGQQTIATENVETLLFELDERLRSSLMTEIRMLEAK